MRTALKVIGAIAALVVLYVAITLARGTYADWHPEGIRPATTYDLRPAADTIRDSVLNFVTWNIGYGGLGADADFFLDAGHFYVSGGAMVHSPEDDVERYNRGIQQQLASLRTEFVLLQEVDSASARSYHRPQFDQLRQVRAESFAAFAPNYISERVPVPVFEPWAVYGDVHSGLATFSAYQPAGEVERHALPGSFPWPDRIFQLDRCLLVQRHPLADGRTLTVVNLHLSAYDDGSVKRDQLAYLAEFLLAERARGHLVVVGGDWNLVPPNFPYDRFIGDPDGRYTQQAVPDDFPEPGWTFIYDARTPTNRKIDLPYVRDSSFVTIIDYFLISPGLSAAQARGIRQDFQFSDHQPVWMAVRVDDAGE